MSTEPPQASPELPAPDARCGARSRELLSQLRDALHAAGGVMGFDEYMQRVLYSPELGYYNNPGHKFGAEGDFVTAPELSPLYAACLAGQCEEIMATLPGADLLELGAGSGALAATLLECLAKAHALPARYLILEPSPLLRARQQDLLRARVPEHYHRMEWLQTLPEPGLCGIIIANEVADALPLRRFVHTRQGLFEQGVGMDDGGRLCWLRYAADDSLRQAVAGIVADLPAPLPFDYCSEFSPLLAPWLASLADCLQQGVMLFADYGCPRREYYHPERHEGTLLCHYHHHAYDDPFVLPGLQDITAWVDFTALAQAVTRCGLELYGYTTQAWFLLGNDLSGAMAARATTTVARAALAAQARVLTLPGEMGERFKVLACGRGYDGALRGFGLRDQLHFL